MEKFQRRDAELGFGLAGINGGHEVRLGFESEVEILVSLVVGVKPGVADGGCLLDVALE